MPMIQIDTADLYYEVTGEGPPIVFAHESAADARQWAPQVEALSQHYRCITYNARGYPPSDVPEQDEAYGYVQAWEDCAAIVEQVAGGAAHIVGLSMGAYAGLMLGVHRPELVRSLFLAGCGTGSLRVEDGRMPQAMEALAEVFMMQGAEAGAVQIAKPPNRTGFQRRDPAAWQAWYDDLLTHSAEGMARTFRNVQARRPSLYCFEEQLEKLDRPVWLAVGEEDAGCLEVNRFLAETIPGAALQIIPQCGHAVNLEAPDVFNAALQKFIDQAENRALRRRRRCEAQHLPRLAAGVRSAHSPPDRSGGHWCHRRSS